MAILTLFGTLEGPKSGILALLAQIGVISPLSSPFGLDPFSGKRVQTKGELSGEMGCQRPKMPKMIILGGLKSSGCSLNSILAKMPLLDPFLAIFGQMAHLGAQSP